MSITASRKASPTPKPPAARPQPREDVLAFRPFPRTHWRKIWSTNLLEQDEHWQREGRRMFSAESRAAIPDHEDIPALLSVSTRDVQNAGPRAMP